MKSKVMLIGIDVCHAGTNSVVGFVATTNNQFTSHYSDIIIQPKFVEIVKKDLDKCLSKALNDFQTNCGGLPDKIIMVMRDKELESIPAMNNIIDIDAKQELNEVILGTKSILWSMIKSTND
mgnify:CR=1 FL=1